MHYYKRNLGDYAKKAGRLSMLQHGAYTLLIDACYDREKFPTLEEAIEWTWASTTEEVEAVSFVLRKFFTLENGLYVQNRIQEEIDDYHDKAATNKRIAVAREETKRAAGSTGRAPVVNDPSKKQDESAPNHKPRTRNQEPGTGTTPPSHEGGDPALPVVPPEKPKRKRKPRKGDEGLIDADDLACMGIDRQHAEDWLRVRAEKNAPLTKTALALVDTEAAKAGIPLAKAIQVSAESNWQGFKATWYARAMAEASQVVRHTAGGRAPAPGRHDAAARAIFETDDSAQGAGGIIDV